jgi:hypothetical protein
MQIKPPSDPVIKKRVYLTNNASPLKRTMIKGFIVVGFIGIIVYFFYPNLFKEIENSTPPQTAGYELTNTPEMLPSFTLADKKTTAPSLETSPNVTSPITIPPMTRLNDEIKVISKQPKPVQIIPQSIANQTVPSDQPVANQAVPIQSVASSSPPVTAASITVPTQTESSTETKTPVERLLSQAQRQLKLTRFTSPKGDNAFQTYQELVQIDTQAAQQVLDKIVAWYLKRGKKYLDKGYLARKTTRRGNNAYKMYQKLLEIAPEHPSTQTFFDEMLVTLNRRAKKQLKKQNSDNAYATYQEMLIVQPDSPKTQALLETIIQQLLARAEEQIKKSWYTSPKDDNAAKTYRQLLKIMPENIPAQDGLKKIAQKYYQLAARKNRQARYEASMKWIKKGLQVNPDDADLKRLKQEVAEKLR